MKCIDCINEDSSYLLHSNLTKRQKHHRTAHRLKFNKWICKNHKCGSTFFYLMQRFRHYGIFIILIYLKYLSFISDSCQYMKWTRPIQRNVIIVNNTIVAETAPTSPVVDQLINGIILFLDRLV